MRALARAIGRVVAILLITLALDYVLLATVFSDLKRHWADAATAYTQSYISSPLHHDLAPNVSSERAWGDIVYHFQTDRYGFRTGRCAPGEGEKSWPAIFVVGDSFTEGIGTSYEKSFVGLMACDAAKHGRTVWNLGVTSYSPLIYYRKLLAAHDRLGIKPAEIYVFVDISDIDDEANVYRVKADGTIGMAPFHHWFDVGQFLLGNFATFRLAYDLYLRSPFSTAGSLGRERAAWSVDPAAFEAWGRRGLALADGNMDKIAGLCREWKCALTVVVYPWPDNVKAGNPNSIQVTHWREWAASRGVRFIDGFAPFFHEPADVAISKYFIRGDVHFSERGNRLLFDEVRNAAGDY
jgi:hypothetical protein